MKSVIINYSVKPEKAEENALLIKGVMDELKEKNIQGMKYAAYKVGDDEFIHIAQFENDDANGKFIALPSFIKFRTNHTDRALSKPVTTTVEEIGSYSGI
jgi:hypothetical protein